MTWRAPSHPPERRSRLAPRRLQDPLTATLVAWPLLGGGCVRNGAETVSGRGDDSMPSGRSPPCADDMVHIPGGDLRGQAIADFCLDATEVTVEAFRGAASPVATELAKSASFPGPHAEDGHYCNNRYDDRGAHPVNCVDWYHADAYCRALGKRLPTEWEWQWAAQGRDAERPYPWGDEPPTCALIVMAERREGCGGDRTWPVGSRPSGDSLDGLKDMAGNVAEWTSSGEKGSRWQPGGRVVRGGCWAWTDKEFFTTSYRTWIGPSDRMSYVGFRCAMEPAVSSMR